MRIISTKKDIVWNFIVTILSMSAYFIILPFSIKFLDKRSLGLWYVFTSIGALANLIDFGFSPSFARYIAYAWSGASELVSEGTVNNSESMGTNHELMSTVLVSCDRIYRIFSFIVFFILISLGTLYILSITDMKLEIESLSAWVLFVVSVTLNIRFSYYNTALRGIGAIAQLSRSSLYARIVQIVISIVFLYLGFGLIGISSAYLMYGLTFRILSKRQFGERTNNQYRELSVGRTEISNIIKSIWPNVWKDGLVQVSSFLANQATTLVSATFLSLAQTAEISILMQFSTAIAAISGAIYTTQQPVMQSAVVNSDYETIQKSAAITFSVYSILFLAGTVGSLIVIFPLLSLLREGFVFDSVLFLLLSVFQYAYKSNTLYASIISNFNQLPYYLSYVITSTASTLLIVVLMWIVPNIGLYAVVIGLALPQMIYNFWKWPAYARRLMKLRRGELTLISIRLLKQVIIRYT